MIRYLKQYPQTLQGMFFALLLSVFFVMVSRGWVLDKPEACPVLTLDEGWTIWRNGEETGADTLSAYATGKVRFGEHFRMSRTLPAESEWPSVSLFFRSLNCAVSVRVDDVCVYEEGIRRYEEGRMVGRFLCRPKLPAGWEGKTLTIELTAAEEDAFYGLGPVRMGTEQDLFVGFLEERAVAFFIAVFLCIFGVLQMFWMPLILREDRGNSKMLFSALTTLVLGVYLLGYYNLFDLFTDVPWLNTLLEYGAFYLVALVMSGYIMTLMHGKMERLYRAFVLFDIGFFVFAVVMHLLNIVHFPRFLLFSYAISFVEASPFLYFIVRGWARHRNTYFDKLEEVADRILATGFFLYVITAFTDAAAFTVVRMSGGQEATVRVPFLTAGSLLFSVAISMHYFLISVVNLQAEATRQALHDRAYSDPLTGLANRGQCDLILDSLGKQHKRFAIVSMDLDYLKQVNDRFGHAEGDRMLKGFADMLKESFEGCELIGRMGGDEFLVVLTGDDCDSLEARLARLKALAEEENKKESVFCYRISYGVAENGETDNGRRTHDIFLLADRRMYDMKRANHTAQVYGGPQGGIG